MAILQKKVTVQLPNGRRVAAPLDDWIMAMLKAMPPEQARKTVELVEHITVLYLPGNPPTSVTEGVGAGRLEVEIGRPRVIQHEPRRKGP